jgi:ppGpp synthetase/RelA/SpoT-type nucleotidyltranferase
MPFSPDLIEPAVRRYRRERDRYVKLADRVAEICKADICEANAIRAQVTFRVKSASSFEGKLRRFSTKPDKNYADLDAIFEGIGDLAGVRIATYREEDREVVKAAVERAFCGRDGDLVQIEHKNRQNENPENFYRAIHVQSYLPEEDRVGTYDNVADVGCEIQICTIMAHVWNEIEHDIGYKPDGDPGLSEKYHLLQLGNLVRQGDVAISSLLAEVGQRLAVQQGPFADVQDFIGRMSASFPGIDFSQNVGQLFEVLQTLGLNTPDAARAAIADPAGLTSAQAEMEKLNAYLAERDESPRMECHSSDVALIMLLRRRYQDVLDSFRGQVGQGRGRPKRLYSLAVRYKKWREHAVSA